MYRLAANQGLAWAHCSLGSMYKNGTGVPQDHAEAVRLYRLAADQGNASGQYSLGLMYDNGTGSVYLRFFSRPGSLKALMRTYMWSAPRPERTTYLAQGGGPNDTMVSFGPPLALCKVMRGWRGCNR